MTISIDYAPVMFRTGNETTLAAAKRGVIF
jgi:hypothetical protein